jgi:hypothetical protein
MCRIAGAYASAFDRSFDSIFAPIAAIENEPFFD